MKLKKGIVTGNIDGQDFAIATGKLASEFQGLINNNESASFIFKLLADDQTEESIVNAMCSRYDGVSKEEIQADVKEFIAHLNDMGVLE